MGNCCSVDNYQASGCHPSLYKSHIKNVIGMKQETPVAEDNTGPNPSEITVPVVEEGNKNRSSSLSPEATHNENSEIKNQQLTNSQLAAVYVASQFVPVDIMNTMNSNVELKYRQLGPIKSSNFASEFEQRSGRLIIDRGTCLKNTVDGSTYEGELKHGVPNGFGKLILANGGVIEGFFKDGLPNGTVRRIYPNGSFYEGEFRNNYPNGSGIYTDEKGKMFHADEWRDSEMFGKILITSPKGFVIFNGTIDRSNGVGQGELFDEVAGTHYVGSFLNSRMHGKGILKKNNGYVYDGEFKSGIEHGQGTRTTVDGRIIIGTFENGRPEGICTLITDKGDELQTVWRKGVIVGKV